MAGWSGGNHCIFKLNKLEGDNTRLLGWGCYLEVVGTLQVVASMVMSNQGDSKSVYYFETCAMKHANIFIFIIMINKLYK